MRLQIGPFTIGRHLEGDTAHDKETGPRFLTRSLPQSVELSISKAELIRQVANSARTARNQGVKETKHAFATL